MRAEIKTKKYRAVLSKGYFGVFFYTLSWIGDDKSFALIGIDGTLCVKGGDCGLDEEAQELRNLCFDEFAKEYSVKELIDMIENKRGIGFVLSNKAALERLNKKSLLNIAFRKSTDAIPVGGS